MEITRNKKAFFDYEILESQEAGIELRGHEVKSIRAKHVNLKGAYIVHYKGELFVKGMHISAYKTMINSGSMDVERERKVLLSKKKIIYYGSKLKEGGYTLLPLSVYLKGSLIKMQVGLAKGKKLHQKKQLLKERTLDREAKKMLHKKY
ncbi:SsrA-binding protein SmpB [Candidatus Gracilibacteria bacterium]|nr:SsrA-binding protein SmpB [Candidatus Gracilibacteria bacterium]